MVARSAAQSKAGRDIGGIPPVADLERRESCRLDLKLFCETYNREAFYYGWSEDHLEAIARLQESVLHGAMYAFAMPRGSGKTTLSRMAALWAVSYAHCRYVFIIGANAGKAQDNLSAIKTWMRFLPEYVADFPEVSHPAVSLGGVAQAANGQLCGGEPTMIEWGKDKIVMATVPPPSNLMQAKKYADTSGCVVGVSGLTGDGIRGSLHTLKTGELLRPDLVLLDDPQTDESAGSASQNVTRERLIAGAVLGMAGPGKDISAVMPCTVIRPGDMVDRLLDRKRHPKWRGTRSKMLREMPKNLDAWDAYFDIYSADSLKEPPDYTESNKYYEDNRETLDEGAVASWEDRKLDSEVSAVQHAMNLYNRDRAAFFAEYQNEPEEDRAIASSIKPDDIVAKATNIKRGVVPLACEHLTAFIDVQKKNLWYCVVAWSDSFGGQVVDYGSWPDQRRMYYTGVDIKRTLQRAMPGKSLQAQLYGGMKGLADELLGRTWKREDGGALNIKMCMIDANWGESTTVVKQFIREYDSRGVLLAAHGTAVGPSGKPMNEWPKKAGQRAGWNWRLATKGPEGRHVRYDGNAWKSFVTDRLATPPGDQSSLGLFKGDHAKHRMFAEQITGEYPETLFSEKTQRRVAVWKALPNRDNHLLDCLVGCGVGASLLGVQAVGHVVKQPARKKRKGNLTW